jgi:hypothetical protein
MPTQTCNRVDLAFEQLEMAIRLDDSGTLTIPPKSTASWTKPASWMTTC